MAARGQTLRLSASERVTVRRPAAETGGALLELEAAYSPRGRPPAEHYHPAQEEHFEVLEGTVRTRVGGADRRLATGETLVVSPGVRHTFWNAGDEEARLRWEVRPALRTEEFFETVDALVRSGKMRGTRPDPLLGFLLLRRYAPEFRLTSPPGILQRPAFAALAVCARIAGRRLPRV